MVSNDINVSGYKKIISPKEMKKKYPLTDMAKITVESGRKDIKRILDGEDNRKLLIVGPCSIHNINETIEYAEKLKELSDKVKDKYVIFMRAYFEKPRTTIGWKGLIYDPDMDGSDNIEKGIEIARKLLLKINEIGLPVATEFLDPIVPQYIGDLVSWVAIGARTTESQIHRQMASGLSMPVGFKNGTSGDLDIAINAISSTANPHSFLGVNLDGSISKVNTRGNKYGHIVLRGGINGPNYSSEDISKTQEKLRSVGLMENVVVDCSHANSGKDYRNQGKVFKDVISQSPENHGIIGLMLESNLFEGGQKIGIELKKGVSITDECIGFEETREIICSSQ